MTKDLHSQRLYNEQGELSTYLQQLKKYAEANMKKNIPKLPDDASPQLNYYYNNRKQVLAKLHAVREAARLEREYKLYLKLHKIYAHKHTYE